MNNSPFFAALQALAPCLSAESKRELGALETLFELFPNRKLSEIITDLKKYQKARRTSPDGFRDRVRDFLNHFTPEGETPETAESLTADFISLTVTAIKAVGKEFDLNISSKNDAEVFENWLRTGTKPPSEADKYDVDLTVLANETKTLRDEDLTDLSNESIAEILDLAARIAKKYKIAGLVIFLNKLGYPPPSNKKTSKGLCDFLHQVLDDLAISRQKSAQIKNFGTM